MAKDEAPAGAPMWMVTFADLMSLLVCFFVLIISFSVPDTEKIKIVAGSMNNAFGFTREINLTGMVEIEGNPQFRFAREVVPIPLDNVIGPIDEDGNDVTRYQTRGAEWQEIDEELLEELQEDFAEPEQAASTQKGTEDGFEPVLQPPLTEEEKFERIEKKLTEVVGNHPELNELADNLAIQRVPEGLRIQLIDQAKKSMFPLGSAQLYPEARALLTTVVAAINSLPNPVMITGHTDALVFKRNDYDNWSLSLDRADATRKVLVASGLDPARIASVTGKGDTEHMIPERPTDPRNRRISITLLREETPAPPADSPAEPVADGSSDGFQPLLSDDQ
ncbi:MAG: flagellar motor protein MotB [Alphaproteobacteria bacterium]